MTLHEEGLIFQKPLFSEAHGGKLKSIFELAENLRFVLTKLDIDLGLSQLQLVNMSCQGLSIRIPTQNLIIIIIIDIRKIQNTI